MEGLARDTVRPTAGPSGRLGNRAHSGPRMSAKDPATGHGAKGRSQRGLRTSGATNMDQKQELVADGMAIRVHLLSVRPVGTQAGL